MHARHLPPASSLDFVHETKRIKQRAVGLVSGAHGPCLSLPVQCPAVSVQVRWMSNAGWRKNKLGSRVPTRSGNKHGARLSA